MAGGGWRMTSPLLEVKDLTIAFPPYTESKKALRNISFTIQQGEALGLVGESGSGKSTIALAIMSYLGRGAKVLGGEIRYRGQSLAGLSAAKLRKLYGRS